MLSLCCVGGYQGGAEWIQLFGGLLVVIWLWEKIFCEVRGAKEGATKTHGCVTIVFSS